MKLVDTKFITQPVIPNRTYTASEVRSAINPYVAAELLYDNIIAQAGGPNMLDDADYADQSDVADISDIWPEEDIIRQVRDLKNQGMQYGPMLQQLIQIGVLGTDRPMAQDIEYLDSVVKRAYRKIAQLKTRPSELVPGEYLVYNDGKSTYHKFTMSEKDGKPVMEHAISQDKDNFLSGSEQITPQTADFVSKKMMLIESSAGGTSKQFLDTRVKNTPKPEEKLPVPTDPVAPDVQELVREDMTESEKRAMLLNFIDFTNKLQTEWNAIYSELQKATHNRPRGLSEKKHKEVKDLLNKTKPSDRPKVLEQVTYPARDNAREMLKGLQDKLLVTTDPVARRDILSDIEKYKALVNKKVDIHAPGSQINDRNALSRRLDYIQRKISRAGSVYKKLLRALGYVDKKGKIVRDIPKNPGLSWLMEAVQTDWQQLQELADDVGDETENKNASLSYEAKETPAPLSGDYFKVKVTHESGSPASPTELSGLLKSLGTSGIVESVDQDNAIFKIDLPEELEHRLIIDGYFKVSLDRFTLESVTPGVQAENNGTADAPIDGQRDTLSSPDIQGTGKIGQQMPAPAPAQPPMSQQGPPGVEQSQDQAPVDMSPEEEMLDDNRSMTEIVDDLRGDLDVLSDKIESGDIMVGDTELELSTSDTGAMPMPGPQKIAVDELAKDYYEDYFGDYGIDLSKDRVAEIVDAIEFVAKKFGVSLTDAKVSELVNFVIAPATGDSFYNDVVTASTNNESIARTADIVLASFLVKNGISVNEDMVGMKPSIFAMALNDAGVVNKFSKVINAQKMKVPSISKQLDDAVDIDDIGDNADEADSKPTQKICFCLDDSYIKGQYMYIELSWDADEVHHRSPSGIKHLIISYIKGLESQKEFNDIGVLGEVNFEEFDPEAGTAVAYFKSSRPGNTLKKVITK